MGSNKLFLLILFCSLFSAAQNNMVDSVIPYGAELYANKQYQLSARYYERAIASGINEGELYYNTACDHALAGDQENAFRNLDSCLKYGWDKLNLTETDPDLEKLHSFSEWNAFIKKFKENIANKRAEKLKHLPVYFWGMYLGFLFVFFIYNIMMFFSVRDKTYLYYGLSIFFVSQLHALVLTQFSFYAKEVFFWLKMLPADKTLSYTVGSVAIIFHLLFVGSFLNLKDRHPKLNRYNKILIWIMIVTSVLLMVLHVTGGGYFILYLAAYLYSFYAGIYSWRKGFAPARFLVLGSVFLTVGIGIVLLDGLGVIDFVFAISVFRTDLMGFILFYALLSFALGDKINVLTREKAEAQERALEVLETKVQERTQELAHEKQLVEEKQKDILDSIRYAKRIQTSLMPNEKYLTGIFNKWRK
jgi:hypothetical protein